MSASDLLYTDDANLVNKAELSQPLSAAVQIALVNLLRDWGITAHAIVGHSSGEIAGAYAAGALTAAEAISCAYYRGFITKYQTRKGGMAAVSLGRDAVAPYLSEGVIIACENSPKSVTLSGDMDALEKAISAIKTSDPATFTRLLSVDMAYHSGKTVILIIFQINSANSLYLTGRSYGRLGPKIREPAAAMSLWEAGNYTFLFQRDWSMRYREYFVRPCVLETQSGVSSSLQYGSSGSIERLQVRHCIP